MVARRRAAKKVTKRAARSQVFRGKRTKSNGGLTKAAFTKNKRNKIVSKKMMARGKRIYKANGLSKWTKAFMQARKELNIKGFVPCKKGSKVYKATMKIYKN